MSFKKSELENRESKRIFFPTIFLVLVTHSLGFFFLFNQILLSDIIVHTEYTQLGEIVV